MGFCSGNAGQNAGLPAKIAMHLMFGLLIGPVVTSSAWAVGRPMDGGLDGVASTSSKQFVLQEKHKEYLPETAQSEDPSQTGIVGVDLLILSDHYPVVQEVFPGTPAEKQGFVPGDAIVSVNGQPTLHRSRTEVDLMISDKPGDVISFTVAHGATLKKISLTVMPLNTLPVARQADFTDKPPLLKDFQSLFSD